MELSGAANAVENKVAKDDLASRYEALIRLAEAIRSHPDERDLFRTGANELRQARTTASRSSIPRAGGFSGTSKRNLKHGARNWFRSSVLFLKKN
jgi:hypothetical protein